MDNDACLDTVPATGSISPVMSLRSVDLPAPFGPTSAILESVSTPNSKSFRSIPALSSAPGYRNDTFLNGNTGGGSLWHSGNENENVLSAFGDGVSPPIGENQHLIAQILVIEHPVKRQ